MVCILKGEGVTSPDILLLLWLFSGNKCVVVCPVLRSLSLSPTVPSQVESPPPVACLVYLFSTCLVQVQNYARRERSHSRLVQSSTPAPLNS